VFQRLVPLFGLDLVLKLARDGEEGLARVLAGVEGSLALVAVAELVEGFETLRDPIARFNDPGHFPVRRLLSLGDQHVAVKAADGIDVVDDVVGGLGFEVLVLDQVVDVGLQFTDAGNADDGDQEQQQQHNGKANAEADADLEIGKHGVTS
jgi:hypothetical protein